MKFRYGQVIVGLLLLLFASLVVADSADSDPGFGGPNAVSNQIKGLRFMRLE